VRFEASTKPPIYNLIHELLINMAFIMACPNFKKGLKLAFGPLGVNGLSYPTSLLPTFANSTSMSTSITFYSYFMRLEFKCVI
jgi:hypothetical protein